MKPKILTILLSGILCCPIYALNWTFHYDPSALSFENVMTEYGVFEKVVWTDAYNEAKDVGMPELPTFYHTLKIADNIIVDTVKITLSNGTSGNLTHPLMPYQQPLPTGYSIEKSQFVKNDRVYQTNDVLPHNSLIDYRVDQARDGKFLSLSIVPYQYNPATNAYTAYSVAEVEVFTHEEDNRLQVARKYQDIGIPYYEYVIITSSQLLSAFEPFAQWKKAKGYNVGIVCIDDILTNSFLTLGDELSSIADDAGKLRQYLIHSYDSVQTKYVLLGGDNTIIPIRYASTDLSDSIPTDFYFAELNCNWDANHNGKYGENTDYVDYGSEVYVGRLLCNSVEEVKNWTKKVLRYEINPGSGDFSYLGRALSSQEDEMQHHREAEMVQQKLQGHINCTIFNEVPDYDAPNPSFPTGSVIIDSINTIHYGLLGNHNHGGPLVYGVASNGIKGEAPNNKGVFAMDSYDELFPTNDEDGNGFDNLTNELYPSIMYSTSCDNMPFDQYNTPTGTYNLGRVFTCRSNGGGPAYIGNTRYGLTPSSAYLQCYFLDSIYVSKNNHIGIAEAKSKLRQKDNYLRHSHNLLGCPEMSFYSGLPSVFNNIMVNISNSKISVDAGLSDSIESRICLSGDVNGIYRQFVFTDRSNVAFDTVPDTYTLVVTMPNYIPYIVTNDICHIQNTTIAEDKIYNGCNIFYIGSDISPMQPYGKVIVENSGNVEIEVGNEVIIKNDFEVKLGGQLYIH